MNVKVCQNIHNHQTMSCVSFSDRHSTMLNATARLAIAIQNFPDFEFSWSDSQPQRSRASLSVNDFLPNESDGIILQERATAYVMEFLVTQFSSLAGLKKLLPPKQQVHPVQKSHVIPMKLLFKDEKQKSETIDILSQLFSDGNLKGTNQVYMHALSVYNMYSN